MSLLGHKRPGGGFGGTLVSAKKQRQDLVAVTGRENAQQIIQSVSKCYL